MHCMQVDVIIDETYALDPTTFTFDSWLEAYNLTGSEDLPALVSQQVYRCASLAAPQSISSCQHSLLGMPASFSVHL